jgi:hypothetical protein
MVPCACNPSYLGDGDRRVMVRSQPGKKLVRPILIIKKQVHDCGPSCAGGRSMRSHIARSVAQVVECPPSKCKVLIQTQVLQKKKKKITCGCPGLTSVWERALAVPVSWIIQCATQVRRPCLA